MNTSHRWLLALGAAIALGFAAVSDFVVWATAHQKDSLYVAVAFAVVALFWAGVSIKMRTRGNGNL